MQFRKGSFEIAIKFGSKPALMPVNGWIDSSGIFGVHRESWGEYILTHIPSGWRLASSDKKSRLTKLAAAMGDLDWNLRENKRASINSEKRWQWPDGTKEAAANIMNDAGFSTKARCAKE